MALPFLKKSGETAAPKVTPQQTVEREQLLEAERVYREGVASVLDIVAPSSLKTTSNYLQIGAQYCTTLFVFVYPRYLETGWFAPIINLNTALDLSFFVYPLRSETILKNLKSKSTQIESQIRINAKKGIARDPVLETAIADIENLRDSLQQGTERFFKFGLYVTVYGDNVKQLNRNVEEVEGILNSRLVYTRRSTLQMEQGFNSTMPLANDELGVTNNMNTSPLSTSFPFISSELSQNDGIFYGINRHNGSLILFDRFTLENANSVIFAKSGGGKSYATKLEILRSMMLGSDVIVIDPENEYQHLADSVGGSFLNISLGSPHSINPFDLPRNSDESVGDLIRSGVIQMKALISIMLKERLDPQEDSLLDTSLIETYAKKDITENTPDLSSVEFPTISDLQEILESSSGGTSLAQRLAKYTTGTHAGLLNKPTNVDLTRQLVVFSIRDLEDELRPVGMFLVLSFIWNITRSSLKRRLLMIDEAWWMMQYEDSARFLFGLAKRARKYYLGVTTISQDVADFLNSDYGRAVVSNASMYLLLKQSPATIDVITQTFHLTKFERQLLLQAQVGQGIFFAGQKHVAIEVRASAREDQIITSDPRQLLEIQEEQAAFAEQMAASDGQEVNPETKA